ncbi:integrase/recombinase XerD [Bradyrhizobium japonicum]|uniref:site-specific integrase n=1 Tax=Bradyrhizobium elkanii TaxID=29448 RepID=UPI0009B7C9B9|nr:site-specific integrase [Bradyrhizobium elkanii]MBP2435245.1 integrase [Bradyrhizobium elkanii]MCP1737593.1 integrase [Bradyrhizobium elkanii]MCS3576150.1 integrase [Bradyrhizobium elkanii]MCS3594515.1 integrase [Bradyrhizobium elkanii]MCS3626104.1 integrase [Bradyrhizobium elkanii]
MSATLSAIPFNQVVDRYLQRQRSLGRGYVHEERVIDALRQFLEKNTCTDLDQALFEGWCVSQGHLSANTRRNRQRIVRNFCLYRQRTEPSCFVPDINRFPRRSPHAPPVIFGAAEVARMLAIADHLAPTSSSPLRPAVMRLAVVLLYTAGLRRGELLRLTLADVDARHGILHIRASKFHKSRIVPLSPDACRELRLYLRKRLRSPLSHSADSPLLCNTKGCVRGYTGTGLREGVQTLFRAGPGCLDSAPLDLSGFLPGYAERGALRFCRCVGRA